MKNRSWIINGCVFLLVLLFVYTATSKIFEFKQFLYQLHLFPWLKKIAAPVAYGVPALELVIAALLVFYRKRLVAFYMSLGLMVLFTLYLFLMLATKQQDLPCTCGGVIQELSWRQHVFFNLLFVGISALGVFYELKFARKQYTQTI